MNAKLCKGQMPCVFLSYATYATTVKYYQDALYPEYIL